MSTTTSTPSTPTTGAHFPALTPDTAPPATRSRLDQITRHLGYLPAAAARLAHAPQLLDGFLKLTALFDATELDPVVRETVVLTIATRNGCHLCVAMHTAVLTRLDADPELIAALRAQQPLPDARLEAVRLFVHRVLDHTGAVPEPDLAAFLAHGFTPRNALEIVLGIGAYTLSTFANRLTDAPVDPQLAPYA
ncbi:AhpD family alkylhydroperoxidase [Kitasatospora sp. SolWspMP-SS2h]|uniref:carboxymuconolactone decarboxylase family protein n=1 Tax=Kitasatospora sp. SolWspMP-SS2h TaxID=1305729 RepID=UPI000DB9027E|nr:carboxymuconolactone decarboxylase family protein [Kitasatospora sp. SolWspMP-SS2h]RAJ29280.1 AhpD family alkylhydroperoxidase [Kitasatospora sp. SolWspMP-SS2h]